MSKGIKLSPKHGLNPTIPICFFCGKEKHEVAILGKIGKKGEDLQAPMRMILDYQPCDDCKEKMKNGIALIGVNPKPLQNGQPPIQKDLYPTGTWCVLKEEAVERIFQIPENEMENVRKAGKMLMDNNILMNLIQQNEENQE